MKYIFFAVVISLCCKLNLAVDTCEKKSSCVCENSKGVLNLTALANTNGIASFKDFKGPKYSFSWNPCLDFSEGVMVSTSDDMCINVAACQIVNNMLYYNLGEQASATFSTSDNGIISLTYIHKLSGLGDIKSRSAVVKLTCGKDNPGAVKAFGESPKGVYTMEYIGVYACQTKSESDSSGLSIGSILCIIFFVVLIVYVIAGVLFQIFYRKSSGWDIIPNKGFWEGVGSSIKDGCKFVFCRHRSNLEKL